VRFKTECVTLNMITLSYGVELGSQALMVGMKIDAIHALVAWQFR
jgi:hypothetical protein